MTAVIDRWIAQARSDVAAIEQRKEAEQQAVRDAVYRVFERWVTARIPEDVRRAVGLARRNTYPELRIVAVLSPLTEGLVPDDWWGVQFLVVADERRAAVESATPWQGPVWLCRVRRGNEYHRERFPSDVSEEDMLRAFLLAYDEERKAYAEFVADEERKAQDAQQREAERTRQEAEARQRQAVEQAQRQQHLAEQAALRNQCVVEEERIECEVIPAYVAEQDAQQWRWPDGVEIVIYKWSWQIGESASSCDCGGSRFEYDEGYALADRLDDEWYVAIWQAPFGSKPTCLREIGLIPAAHRPVVERLRFRSTDELPDELLAPQSWVTIPGIHFGWPEGLDGDDAFLIMGDPGGRRGTDSVERLLPTREPLEWIRDAVDAQAGR